MDNFDDGIVARRKASTDKSRRIMLLAVLFQLSWPHRLTCQDIIAQLPLYGEGERPRAVHRDIETLTGCQLKDLPTPDNADLEEWCTRQRNLGRLTISYVKHNGSFGLEQPVFPIDINEEEARAFVALQEGFTPGSGEGKGRTLTLKKLST